MKVTGLISDKSKSQMQHTFVFNFYLSLEKTLRLPDFPVASGDPACSLILYSLKANVHVPSLKEVWVSSLYTLQLD